MSKSDYDPAYRTGPLGQLPLSEFQSLRYSTAEMISVIAAVRHRFQKLADKEGLTGPITEQVMQLDVVLQTLEEHK
jgi:hypothetical protein